jgi:hypothetical protein
MSLREAAQQALEALDEAANVLTSSMFADAATALRTALAEPEQIEVLTCPVCGASHEHYTHPPQPVELTDDDLEDIAIAARKGNLTDLRNAIERAHGIGGEA